MAKRSHSEETELRALLVKLTDHVLEMKAEQAANHRVIKVRLDELEREQGLQSKAFEKKIETLTGLIGETLKKTNELHVKVLGSADSLGRRIHELEKASKRSSGRASGRG